MHDETTSTQAAAITILYPRWDICIRIGEDPKRFSRDSSRYLTASLTDGCWLWCTVWVRRPALLWQRDSVKTIATHRNVRITLIFRRRSGQGSVAAGSFGKTAALSRVNSGLTIKINPLRGGLRVRLRTSTGMARDLIG